MTDPERTTRRGRRKPDDETPDEARGQRRRPSSRAPQPDLDEAERLMRMVAKELGATAESALAVAIDRGQDVGLRVLEQLAAQGIVRGRVKALRVGVTTARLVLGIVPNAGGRVVSGSSFFAMDMAWRLLRRVHRTIESAR